MRMNISVPDELAEQVRTMKIPISETCQRALRDAVEAAMLRDTSGMEEITVEVGDPAVVVGFVGRWLVFPNPGNQTGLGGMYYGVALTKRGRVAVYAGHIAGVIRAALNDFDSLDEAEKSGVLPREIAALAAGVFPTEDRVVWRDI